MKKCWFIVLHFLVVGSIYAQTTNQEALEAAIKSSDTVKISKLHELDSGLINTAVYWDGFLSSGNQYPIHIALRYGNMETIKFLLRLGADPSNDYSTSAILSSTQTSSLEILVKYRDLAYLQKLLHLLKPSPRAYSRTLQWTAENKEFEKVKYLLAEGEKVLLRND